MTNEILRISIFEKKEKELVKMKAIYIKQLVTLIFIVIGINANSQTDSNRVYYPGKISINYIIKQEINPITLKTERRQTYKTLKDINKLKFLNDSIISVSGQETKSEKLNVNQIVSIDYKDGSYIWLGLGIGALTGLGIGVAIGATTEPESSPNAIIDFRGIQTAGAGFIGLLAGGLIGGIVGGNINSNTTLVMDKTKSDQKKELIKILNIKKGF